MRGYGLMQAVQAYQQGTEWRQRQDQLEKQQKLQAGREAADKAAADVLEASKAEWALNGAQGAYQPNDNTMFKAAQARGTELAKVGDWPGYLQNETQVQQQRIRVRASALQRYEQDGDFEALARTVDPTMANGKEIVGTERIGGMPGLASIGRDATPTKFRFKFSDGSATELDPDVMVKKLKLSLVDPVKAAEQEVEMNFLRTKAQIEADKQKDVEREKGAQARLTDDQRTKNDLTVEERKTDGSLRVEGFKAMKGLALAEVNNKADLQRTQVSAGATVKAAGIGAEARKYAADQGLAGAKVSAGGKMPNPTGDAATVKDLDKLQKLIVDAYGERSDPTLGAGPRIGNDATMKMARGVQALMSDQPDMALADAIAQVRKDFEAARAARAAAATAEKKKRSLW